MDSRLEKTFPKSFDEEAWLRVKLHLRPALCLAILQKDWNKVAEIWESRKYLLEKAIRGKNNEIK